MVEGAGNDETGDVVSFKFAQNMIRLGTNQHAGGWGEGYSRCRDTSWFGWVSPCLRGMSGGDGTGGGETVIVAVKNFRFSLRNSSLARI